MGTRPTDPLLEDVRAAQEDRLRTMREAGEEPVDRYGRPRVDISGTGPEAAVVRATRLIRKRKPLPETEGFGVAKFRALYRAVALANLQGFVLNTFVTVSWGTVGITSEADINVANKWLLRRLREWCTARRDPIPFALIWVKEHSSRLGTHSHILLHVDRWERPRLGHTVKAFVEKYAGRPVLAGQAQEDGTVLSTIYTDGPRAKVETSQEQITFQWRVFRYLMKGATLQEWTTVVGHTRARVLFGGYARLALRDQGPVVGKRIGASTSLGRRAWQTFAEAHDLDHAWLDVTIKRLGFVYGDEFLREHDALRSRWAIRASW